MSGKVFSELTGVTSLSHWNQPLSPASQRLLVPLGICGLHSHLSSGTASRNPCAKASGLRTPSFTSFFSSWTQTTRECLGLVKVLLCTEITVGHGSGASIPGGLGPRWEVGFCLRNTLVHQKKTITPPLSPMRSPEQGFIYRASNYLTCAVHRA